MEQLNTGMPDSGSPSEPGQATILLLDSDSQLRDQVRALGRRQQFVVFSAMTYAQAKSVLLLRKNIQVALVGIYAARFKETRQALIELRQSRPDLCVIALADIRDTDMALDLVQDEQIFRYMIKPVKEQELLRNIRAGFDHSEMLGKIEELRAIHLLPDEDASVPDIEEVLKQ